MSTKGARHPYPTFRAVITARQYVNAEAASALPAAATAWRADISHEYEATSTPWHRKASAADLRRPRLNIHKP